MVMKPDVLDSAIDNVCKTGTRVIYMSPGGKPLTQKKAAELSQEEHLAILCGHYEGIDDRVLFLRCIARRKIDFIALCGVCLADFVDDIAEYQVGCFGRFGFMSA
jgi:tRNA (guanine37-N1)-methyltransferase